MVKSAPKTLSEGEVKRTPLPCPPEGKVDMVQRVQFGLHSVAIEIMGIEKSKVYVRDYPHWESAFNAAMDKAGI